MTITESRDSIGIKIFKKCIKKLRILLFHFTLYFYCFIEEMINYYYQIGGTNKLVSAGIALKLDKFDLHGDRREPTLFKLLFSCNTYSLRLEIFMFQGHLIFLEGR